MVDLDISELQPERLAEARAVLIAGPTASGKSALAMSVGQRARQIGRAVMIVNADSMQVYDGLDILTARPSPEDMSAFAHRLYGHVDPQERYSVGRWLGDVAPILAGGEKIGSSDAPLAIVVGGTGLYFRALTDGLTDIPDIPEAIVVRWQERLREEGVSRLHDQLAAWDKEGAAALSPGDPQRIVRALSVLEATGRTLGDWQVRGQATASQPLIAAGATIRLALTPNRDWLIHRIEQRFDKMVAAGAAIEVEAFLRRDLDGSLPAMKAIGVSEFAAFLDQSIPLDQAVERAKIRTRQYAKRQMTWVRNQMADWTFVVPN